MLGLWLWGLTRPNKEILIMILGCKLSTRIMCFSFLSFESESFVSDYDLCIWARSKHFKLCALMVGEFLCAHTKRNKKVFSWELCFLFCFFRKMFWVETFLFLIFWAALKMRVQIILEILARARSNVVHARQQKTIQKNNNNNWICSWIRSWICSWIYSWIFSWLCTWLCT